MKVSKDFILREIADEIMLVPIGAAAARFNGLITMNELGKFIFDTLSEDRTPREVAEKIISEYDVDLNTALADTEDFLQQLRQIGALVE